MRRSNKYLFLTAFAGLIFSAVSCHKNSEIETGNAKDMNTTTLNSNMLTDSFQLVNSRTFFFGHQSVGYNIVDGIQDILKQNPGLKLNVREDSLQSVSFDTPVFAHARVGKNGEPYAKIDDFCRVIKKNGDKINVAFLKLCYVDINRKTDVNRLFSYYKSSADSLKAMYPQLKLIHFTIPLTTRPAGIKGMIKSLLRMDSNVNRARYNDLIRKNFPENEIFDIAALESTYPSGTSFTYGIGIHGLIPEYASDEGHLNEEGRLRVAGSLLLKIEE